MGMIARAKSTYFQRAIKTILGSITLCSTRANDSGVALYTPSVTMRVMREAA